MARLLPVKKDQNSRNAIAVGDQRILSLIINHRLCGLTLVDFENLMEMPALLSVTSLPSRLHFKTKWSMPFHSFLAITS
jgi:hypothetical protein